MKTKLTALIQENDNQMTQLKESDTEILKQIMKYFSLYPVSSIDSQTIRKDLIGMAQEAEQRGESLQDMIGEDLKAFCEGVLENIRKDKTEYRLRMLFDGLVCVSIWYLADWGLYNSFSLNHGIKGGLVLIYPLFLIFSMIINKYIERSFMFRRSDGKNHAPVVTIMFIVIYMLITLVFVPKDLRQAVLFYVPGWVVAFILVILTAIAYLLLWVSRNRKSQG